MLKTLIVDDDEIALLVESKILQRCGVSEMPLTFKSGELAMEYLSHEDTAKNFLLLLDINMPGMNGWEFLEKLQELQLQKSIYIIMVTSSIDRHDKNIAEKYNSIISFIEKPITSRNCEEIKLLPEIKHFFL